MLLRVETTPILKGKVMLPASKSYSIRAFITAACGGRSIIVNPSNCDDAQVARRVAKFLGAKVTLAQTSRGPAWRVASSGVNPRLDKIDVGESGTVLRFLLPILGLIGKPFTVTGEGTLLGRPNLFLTKTLRNMGLDIQGTGSVDGIPIELRAGRLRAGKVAIDGSLSSQFISALLIACPQLASDTYLSLTGQQLVSSDYIEMTSQVLKRSGIQIKRLSSRNFFIKGPQVFQGLKTFEVPSDYGLAAFLMGASLLTDSTVTLSGNLNDVWIQADGHIVPFLKKMGGRFQKTRQSIRIKGPSVLKGGSFSLKDCPDLVPIMAVLALFARGVTRLRHIGHARVKESDRISDVRRELLKIGADIRERPDELIIHPRDSYKRDCLLDPHRDHRLAMAFSVLGLKLGARVQDIECVSKSYPDFIRDLRSLGAIISKGA